MKSDIILIIFYFIIYFYNLYILNNDINNIYNEAKNTNDKNDLNFIKDKLLSLNLKNRYLIKKFLLVNSYINGKLSRN